MRVRCPKCGLEQDYRKRSNKTKRKRKKCKKCGRFFEVKSNVMVKPKRRPEPENNEKIKLSKADIKILDLISRGINTQKKIANRMRVSIPAVSKKLKKLESLNLVLRIGYSPSIYLINENKEGENKETEERIPAVTAHKIQFKIGIKSFSSREFFSMAYKKTELRNLIKKYIRINGVVFQVNNEKSIVFFLDSAGRTPAETLDNAKKKAWKITEFLEKRFGLELTAPVCLNEKGRQRIHYVPVITDKNKLEYARVWSDDSHDGSIETDSAEFVDEIISMKTDMDNLKNAVGKIDMLAAKFEKLTEILGEFVCSLKSALGNFGNSGSGQIDSGGGNFFV